MTVSCLELVQNGPQLSRQVKGAGRVAVSDTKLWWTNSSPRYCSSSHPHRAASVTAARSSHQVLFTSVDVSSLQLRAFSVSNS